MNNEISNDKSVPASSGELGTRRQFIAGMVTGAMATAIPSALAQPAATSSATNGTQYDIPVPDYPYPPFPAQQQEWPGLASLMNPVPDHGETSYRGTGRLVGRKALITGGDSGIGRAAAIAFAREGADVAISYLPAEQPDADQVLALIRAEQRTAIGIAGDIRYEGFCEQMVLRAVRDLGGLDILVNSAGRQHAVADIADLTTQLFDWTIKTNQYALFWITKAAIPYLTPGSAIINLASVESYQPNADLLDYAQTKAAVANFTRGLAKQLVSKKIRVNAVAPGPFWTPLQVTGGQPPDKIPTFGTQAPIGRAGQPVELANVFVELASYGSSYTTGQVHGVNGAMGLA